MSMYVEKIKTLVERLETPVLFLTASIGSSAISIWSLWYIFEWAHGK